MKVILFGATGMVGQGVLRECLRDDGVEGVLAVGRSSTGRTHPKLRELVRKDLFDFGAAGADLQGYDACFFCLGVSVAGMNEADYTRLTYDLTLGWAQTLAQINPLYHCVQLVRHAVFGFEGLADLAHAGVLVGFALLTWRLAVWRLSRRLVN